MQLRSAGSAPRQKNPRNDEHDQHPSRGFLEACPNQAVLSFFGPSMSLLRCFHTAQILCHHRASVLFVTSYDRRCMLVVIVRRMVIALGEAQKEI